MLEEVKQSKHRTRICYLKKSKGMRRNRKENTFSTEWCNVILCPGPVSSESPSQTEKLCSEGSRKMKCDQFLGPKYVVRINDIWRVFGILSFTFSLSCPVSTNPVV